MPDYIIIIFDDDELNAINHSIGTFDTFEEAAECESSIDGYTQIVELYTQEARRDG